MNKLETLKDHKVKLEKRCAGLSRKIEGAGNAIENLERSRMQWAQPRIEYREKIQGITKAIYQLQGEE